MSPPHPSFLFTACRGGRKPRGGANLLTSHPPSSGWRYFRMGGQRKYWRPSQKGAPAKLGGAKLAKLRILTFWSMITPKLPYCMSLCRNARRPSSEIWVGSCPLCPPSSAAPAFSPHTRSPPPLSSTSPCPLTYPLPPHLSPAPSPIPCPASQCSVCSCALCTLCTVLGIAQQIPWSRPNGATVVPTT